MHRRTWGTSPSHARAGFENRLRIQTSLQTHGVGRIAGLALSHARPIQRPRAAEVVLQPKQARQGFGIGQLTDA